MTPRILRLFPKLDLPAGSGLPITALALAGCLTTLGGGAFLPVFPEIIEALAIDEETAALVAVVHTLTGAIFTPIFGWVADRAGAKRVLLIGLLCYGAAGMLPAFVTDVNGLIAARCLEGAFKGAVLAAGMALVLGYLRNQERAQVFGYGTSLITIASALTFFAGGWLGAIDWRYAFFLYAMALPIAVFAFLVVQGPLVAPKSPSSDVAVDRSLAQILLGRRFLGIAAAVLVVAGGGQAFRVYGPIYLKEVFDAGPGLVGGLLAVMAIGVVLSSALAAGRMSTRFGSTWSVAIGMAAMGVAIGILVVDLGLVGSVVGFAIFGVGFGVVLPNLFDALALEAPVDKRATVLASGQAVNSLGLFITPLVLGTVWAELGIFAVLISIAATMPLVGVFLTLAYRKTD